jgi:cobalamin 5'-phosphate synthase/cobalamin synthase
MKNIFKGFALSVSMLTTLPFFKVHDFSKGINGYAVMFYPLVGFIVGLIIIGIYLLLKDSLPMMHLGIILFVVLVLLTGALHLDGFADTIDGLFVNKEKSFDVMKDPNVGAMGMIFSTVFLIFKASSIVALLSMDENFLYILPIVLMLSRFNAVIAIYFFPYISKGGIGTLAKEEFKLHHIIVSSLYVILFSYLFFKLSFVVMSLLVLFSISVFFMKRYGGFSGDIYGFTIEVSELLLINLLMIFY